MFAAVADARLIGVLVAVGGNRRTGGRAHGLIPARIAHSIAAAVSAEAAGTILGGMMRTGARRWVMVALCLISGGGLLAAVSNAADATTRSFGTLGAFGSATDTGLLTGILKASSSDAQASPDPSLVGEWDVTSSCSGSPCGDTLDISIGGQSSDPACSANEYCITTGSGFYGEDVSVTPNGAGTWTYTCDGCTGSEDIDVHFKGPTFSGTATPVAPDGTKSGPIPYSGTCGNCAAPPYTLSGTITKGCGGSCPSRPTRIAGVTVTAQESTGESASATTNRKGAYKLHVTKGDWTVTPTRTSYHFSPPDRRVDVTKSVSGVNFLGCGRSADEQASVSDAGTAAVTPGLYENKKSIPEDESCAKEFFEVRIKKDGNLEASWDAALALPRDPLKLQSKIFKFEKKGPLPLNTPIRLSAPASDTYSAEVTITIPDDAPAHVLLNNALANWTVFGDLYQAKINLTPPNHALTYDLPAG